MLPQIDNPINNNTSTIELPSKTYKLDIDYNKMIGLQSNRIIGYADNIDAVRQAVFHILATERYAYLIYDSNYGVELEQYIGKDFEYIQATIGNTLKEALLMDLRIKDIIVTDITKVNTETVNIQFTVISIYGDLQMEVNISV